MKHSALQKILNSFLIAAFLLAPQASRLTPDAAAATGCNYPSSLDTWADKASGDSLTQSEFNARTCATEKLEAELGAAVKGSFGSVKLRLDDLDLIRAGKAGGQSLIGGTASGENLTLQSTSNSTRGAVRIIDNFELDDETPAQITSDQNNYALGKKGVHRLSTDAARTLTGATGGGDATIKILQNVGSFPIILAHENGSSTAANRFTIDSGGPLTLHAGRAALLVYDATATRWRVSPLGNRQDTIVKTADETVNNSVTLQDDDHLKFSCEANASYGFKMSLLLSAAGATPDWKLGWTVPASATMLWGPDAGSSARWDTAATGASPSTLLAETDTSTFGSVSGTHGVTLTGVARCAGTAGTVQFQWAQNTLNASDNKLLKDSWMTVVRLN